jgi:plasmid stabilization system protein ParE
VKRRLVVRAGAEKEIVDAAGWYENRSVGLAAEFLRAIDAVIASIERNPLLYPEVASSMRRALLRRFPFSIVYRASEDEVVIVGCVHWRRHERRWRGRS